MKCFVILSVACAALAAPEADPVLLGHGLGLGYGYGHLGASLLGYGHHGVVAAPAVHAVAAPVAHGITYSHGLTALDVAPYGVGLGHLGHLGLGHVVVAEEAAEER